MKRFLSASAFCAFLLTLGFFVFSPVSKADGNILVSLLNLPAPPPPNPAFQTRGIERSAQFYDQNNPPHDEAPIEDLMDYWRWQSQIDPTRGYVVKPSERTLERIKEQIEKDPRRLTEFLNLFIGSNDGANFVKRFYDREVAFMELDRVWRDAVRRWLTYNSPYFSDELLRSAQQVRDTGEYVTNQEELLALAKVDWEKAKPILERFLNDSSQPVSQTLARWAFYQHALDTGDSSEAERFRRELQATVENRSEKPGNRDLAMDALVRGGDFEGRDEWYLKLLEDETLHDLRVGGQTYTGLTTIINFSPPDKYTARMLELLKSDSKVIRSAAARNLAVGINAKNPKVVRALLPWLEDPQWANDVGDSRRAVINALAEIYMPESVHGLLAVLNEKKVNPVNYSANVAVQNGGLNGEYRPYLYEALQALAKQKDARAVPVLRTVLTEIEGWQIQIAVNALLKCGGFSVEEQVEAIETVVRSEAQNEEEVRENANTTSVENSVKDFSGNTNTNRPQIDNDSAFQIKISLGAQLLLEEEPSDALVRATAERISALERSEPDVARTMRRIMRSWKGATVYAILLRDLQNGKADIEDVIKLLSRRRELRENHLNDIYSVRSGSALAVGISACLLEDANTYDAILEGENSEVKTAMLACARLVRAPLSVEKVAENLRSEDKLLRTAAEKYLEAEDSPEARAIVLSLYPNQAKILGARTFFGKDFAFEEVLGELFVSVHGNADLPPLYFFNFDSKGLGKTEKRLQKEVLENAELVGIYAYNDNFVRIYRDRAVFSWQEDSARFRERVLETDEFEELKNFLAENRVDELPPFLSLCDEDGCDTKELLMLGRAGGRRVFMHGNEPSPFFAALEKIFEDFRRQPARLRYYVQNSVPGLEILFEDENLKAETVWKNGADLRVLVNNYARREQIKKELEAQKESEEKNSELDAEERYKLSLKRYEMRAYENFSWHRFAGGRLLETVSQPADVGFIPPRDSFAVQPDQNRWKARNATIELRADEEGLYKIAGGQMTKIRSGHYEKPLMTPNGRWAVVKKYGVGEGDFYGVLLMRVNLQTGSESVVKFKPYEPVEPLIFVPALNKFLLATVSYGEYDGEHIEEYGGEDTPEFREFYWLDVETGALQPAKGNLKPLAHQTFRSLQPVAGKPDEFWAAIPDAEKNSTQIGTFNARTLTFNARLVLPQIEFDSMKLWVDEAERKAYFTYQGHLLAAPLPK